MLAVYALIVLACTPNPGKVCTREFDPVCADGTEYSNLCQAQAAGFTGECAVKVVPESCNVRNLPTAPTGLNCGVNEFYSETGSCVPKPWSDFNSCAEEKHQGACPGGTDPNPWVGMHCLITCQ